MKNGLKMSLFVALTSLVEGNLMGRVPRPVTVYPSRGIALQEVAWLITGDPAPEYLTQWPHLPLETSDKERSSELRRQTLPYVTPCGTFSYRKSDRLLASSGSVAVDVDGSDSTTEAEALWRQLFDDAYLCPALCLISLSEWGVKVFVPYPEYPGNETPAYIPEHILDVISYMEYVYGDGEARGPRRVDLSGKDTARPCLLRHDPNAFFRIWNHNS